MKQAFNNGEISKLKSLANLFYQRWNTYFNNHFVSATNISETSELTSNFDTVNFYNNYFMSEGNSAVCYKNQVRYTYSVLRTGEAFLTEIYDARVYVRFLFNGKRGSNSLQGISRTNNGKSTEILSKTLYKRWTYMQPQTVLPTVVLSENGGFYTT